jgi:hypothetical protein
MERLEGIFRPYAQFQRINAYKHAREFGDGTSEQDLRLVHYTTADSALKIINTKRIWMRNTACMADYRELEHGYEILARYLSDDERKAAFTNALERVAPGCAREAIDIFRNRWSELRGSIYVVSVSEHAKKEDSHGRLSMWRGFGGATARVALVLKVPRYSEASIALKLLFSPVAYLTEAETRDVLDQVTRNISENSDFLRSVPRPDVVVNVFAVLLAGVICLKHEGFQEEREWRAIYLPTLNSSSLMQCSTKVIEGVPQIVYQLPLDVTHDANLADLEFSQIFERLIIGPSQYPWVMKEAFAKALTSARVPNAAERVVNSFIPIRT